MAKIDDRKRSSDEPLLVGKFAMNMVYEQGFTKLEAAVALGVTEKNVGRWCRLYEESGFDVID